MRELSVEKSKAGGPAEGRRPGAPRWLRVLACLVAVGAGTYLLIDHLLWGASGEGAPATMADAPKAMQNLSAAIQGKTNRVIRWAILWRYGRADRDIGSGVSIEQWDLPEGVLTMHRLGPSFTEASGAKTWHLLGTVNPLGDCLLNRYEMRCAVPGKAYWLGQLILNGDMTYHYSPPAIVLPPGEPPVDFYFMDHPDGRIEIRYEAGITAETLLETLPQEAVVAQITFFSSNGAGSAIFPLKFSNKHRWLELEGGMPYPFSAGRGVKDTGVTR